MQEEIRKPLERISDRDWKRTPPTVIALLLAMAEEMAYRTEAEGDFEVVTAITTKTRT